MTSSISRSNLVFTADDTEPVSDEALLDHLIEGEPVEISFADGQELVYWKGAGGPTPTYQLHVSGALILYMDDEVFTTYGPTAWLNVSGPQRDAG